MRPTIKQTAKLANIPVGTVDRVLNNGSKVNSVTKEKIEKIIKDQRIVQEPMQINYSKNYSGIKKI